MIAQGPHAAVESARPEAREPSPFIYVTFLLCAGS
jgi:hypothetical protein